MRFPTSAALAAVVAFTRSANAVLNLTETATEVFLSNDRLSTVVRKANGIMTGLTLDGINLVGTPSGSTGRGPYVDCYCTPAGFWTPGGHQSSYELYSGTDATGTPYGGIKMSDTHRETGQIFEQYWFLREGETGLHMFTRIAYYNETKPFLRNLQELRTLLRPNTPMWTHLVTNKEQFAPMHGKEALAKQVTVQDATWYMGNVPNDPYVSQMSDYFTKYTFQDTWRDHKAHGMFADGSQTKDNLTYGAWMVHNTRETYWGGPLNSDLTVDGIVYNYIVSNHHGNQTPNITHGFDRTFGPQYYYFNTGPAGTTMETLHADAEKLADPEWNAPFYDSIAKHLPNPVTDADRTTWKLHVDLPEGAKKPLVVLSAPGHYFQDNVFDTKTFQYWADIDANGDATIPRVKVGTYRMTIYAEGIFGTYIKDPVEVIKDKRIHTTHARWREEKEGTEIWRIGTPDMSSGEYRHGLAKVADKPLHPPEHLIYFAQWDYPTDFPNGVHFKVGESDIAKDLNYVHWSVFGGYGNSVRKERYLGNGDVNNWTIAFDLNQEQIHRKRKATFTVQLAGVKTAAGNTDVYDPKQLYSNLPYTVNVNGKDLEPWVIPYYHSSSCAVRSAVICYQTAHKFEFDPDMLKAGENTFVLSLPFNSTSIETALLTEALYVQYDALRFEIM